MTTTTRTLLLMRHSEAGHGGGGDHARELTAQGHRDSRAAGRWLADQVGEIDHVVVSSATRTRQTWEDAVDGGARGTDVQVRDEVYDAGARDLADLLLEVPDEARSVLVVGHVPGVPALVQALASADSRPEAVEAMGRGFATTTIARLTVERPWGDVDAGTADLVEVVTPRG